MIRAPLDTFLQGEIYVDTMVFYMLLRAEERVRPLVKGFFERIEITTKDIQAMLQNMLDYPLRPRDALHVATMQRLGCFNLASNDHHLDVVPILQRFFIEVA